MPTAPSVGFPASLADLALPGEVPFAVLTCRAGDVAACPERVLVVTRARWFGIVVGSVRRVVRGSAVEQVTLGRGWRIGTALLGGALASMGVLSLLLFLLGAGRGAYVDPTALIYLGVSAAALALGLVLVLASRQMVVSVGSAGGHVAIPVRPAERAAASAFASSFAGTLR